TYPLDEISGDETLQILDSISAAAGSSASAELRGRVSETLAQRPAEWWNARDPLLKLEATILNDGIAREADLATIRDDVQTMVREALAFARQSPDPSLAAAPQGVYRGQE